MQTIKRHLQNKLPRAGRIAVLGIGSDLRGDDAAGMLASEMLANTLAKKRKPRIKTFFGSTAPENLTGEIRRFKPAHLVMIDSIEMGEGPGTILVLDPGDIGGSVSFSTHKMPVRILADYLSRTLKCGVTIIGIQPASLEFGAKPSKEVKSAAREIARAIYNP